MFVRRAATSGGAAAVLASTLLGTVACHAAPGTLAPSATSRPAVAGDDPVPAASVPWTGDNDVHWAGLRHDTFSAADRSPFGAVPVGTAVTLRLATEPQDVTGVTLRTYRRDAATGATEAPVDTPMRYAGRRTENGRTFDAWSLTLTTPAKPSLVYYKFAVADGADLDWYGDDGLDDHDNLRQGGTGAPAEDEPHAAFQISVYDKGFTTPAWLANAAVYQIFPDRFRNGDPSNDYCRAGSRVGCPTFYGTQQALLHPTWNAAIGDPHGSDPAWRGAFGNQFYGGDLQGVTGKLDYLTGLGFDTIYLNPIFAARSNHRYDTDDFLTVDPSLGGDAAFTQVVAAARARGMRVLLDGVFNHASSDSRYFDRYHRYPSDGACESTSSPYRAWFAFSSDRVPCGAGDYEGWAGYDSLAVFRDDAAGVRDFFYRGRDNVTEHWYERGAAGWRFDVANEISHDWWHAFRPTAKALRADGPLIGEVWEDASAYLLGDQLDSVMNYRFRKNVLGFARGVGWKDNDNNGRNEIVGLTPSTFDRALRAVREDYPPAATAAMLNLIDSHDTNRALTTLTLTGDNGLVEAKQRLRLAALMQYGYPGVPMVYYGDEAGLHSPSRFNGANGPEDDPYNRAPFPWPDAGGDPGEYGPMDASLVRYYTALGQVRRAHPALRTGSFATLLTGDTTASRTDDTVYAFARKARGDVAVVALNNGSAPATATIPVRGYLADGARLLDPTTGRAYRVARGGVTATLPARSGVLLVMAP